ncbi:hypothetical protein OROMI_002397 [Orobanche minor]
MALKNGFGEKVQLATKFGVVPTGVIRGDPAYVREACEASLKRLGIDCIDLYYQHRIDKTVPIEATMGELKKLVKEGKIKYVGLSEASASTIRRAHAVQPLSAIQLEWSLFEREVEEEIVPTCRELGIGIIAYSPSGRGFLSDGPKVLKTFADDDYRKVLLEEFEGDGVDYSGYFINDHIFDTDTNAIDWAKKIALQIGFELIISSYKNKGKTKLLRCNRGERYRGVLRDLDAAARKHTKTKACNKERDVILERFQGENLEHNKILYERLCSLAAKKNCTPSELSLAWSTTKVTTCAPFPGPPRSRI